MSRDYRSIQVRRPPAIGRRLDGPRRAGVAFPIAGYGKRQTLERSPAGHHRSRRPEAARPRGPLHGYATSNHLADVSGNAITVQEGSLYPALHRMKQAGWLRATWGASENGRRARYDEITPAGRTQLAEEKKKWAELTDAVSRVLKHA
jgi:PadR family transcriptional regulator